MSAASALGDLAAGIAIRTDDSVLTAELQAGSEEAFALLIAQYQAPIFSLISRVLTDPSDAADITQDVFIKVFRNIGSFHGDSSLRTWMYRIALARGLESAPLVVTASWSRNHDRDRDERVRRRQIDLSERSAGRRTRLAVRADRARGDSRQG